MASYVFTVLGDDRPGLVDHLSGVVSRHHGNWERSQMARLGGKFAGIVQVGVPDQHADDLRAALEALDDPGTLDVSVDIAVDHTASRDPESSEDIADGHDGRRLVVSLVGTDRPGLVHAVSAAMAAVGANIDELTTSTTDAPMSGDPLFEATATVTLPHDVDMNTLRTRLEALADRLMVDIALSV
ncbi:MAG: amino acid-binding ACT protein [Ilumatobacter sp.]|nr:MAG: amino acid-binding ACT protein [Ilumatobacter sp.]